MKTLIISVSCLALLVVIWSIYNYYSDNKLRGFIDEISYNIISNIESEDWEAAASSLSRLSDDWNQYRRVSVFFVDRTMLNSVEHSIARAKYYIKAKDLSNSTGELAYLKVQLNFFHTNDSFNLENIF